MSRIYTRLKVLLPKKLDKKLKHEMKWDEVNIKNSVDKLMNIVHILIDNDAMV